MTIMRTSTRNIPLKTRPKTRLLWATFALSAAVSLNFSSPAHAASDSGAGTMTVNGKTTAFHFAHARQVPGFFDSTKKDIEVVLSDVALPANAIESSFERSTLAAAGKLHAFQITIDSTGTPISTSFYDNAFKEASPSGGDSSDVFTKKSFTSNSLEGSYKSSETHDFFGSTYSFDVTFAVSFVGTPSGKPTPTKTSPTKASPKPKAKPKPKTTKPKAKG
jgi:hypothetical protein